MNAQSPINLDEEEQQYLELTKEYRNWDEMRFRAHRIKYKLEDRTKRRSLKVVTRKPRGDTSPVAALIDIDSHSMADGMLRCGKSFKIHLEKTQRPSLTKNNGDINDSNESENQIGERSISPIEKIS
jgi:hypothetical protein